MRSLSLLVLLLFAVVMCTAKTPEQGKEQWKELMKELVANGTRQRLKAYNGLYLTDDRPLFKGSNFWAMPKQDWLQDFTIVQVSDIEVAIKSHLGHYIGRDSSPDGFSYAEEKQEDDWDDWDKRQSVFIPIKNDDGSWSFFAIVRKHGISIDIKWLSAHAKYDDQRHYVNFQPENLTCEKWKLEPYTPPATPKHMEELLTNGGRRKFRSFNGLYLTDDYPNKYVWTLPQRVWSPPQEWTIVPINNNEVVLKSYHRGYYIGHGSGGWATQVPVADEWEILTPVKNADGTWSFKSGWNKWLSGHYYKDVQKYYATFEKELKGCEKWRLEPAS